MSFGPARPHLLYLGVGFPPAAKSGAHRMLAVANEWVAQGWDVTVLTIEHQSWKREFGLDQSLARRVDPAVRVIQLPLARVDLDPQVSNWSYWRARYPGRWLQAHQLLARRHFPEKHFGSWDHALEQGALAVHAQRPVDLVLVSPAPYVQLAAAWRLHTAHAVPYVVDFRDAWSLDVIAGGETFPQNSRRGRWERRLMLGAQQVWLVNDPIRDHYAARYPQVADRFRVVRNGYDEIFLTGLTTRRPDPSGLTFGYLGTATLPLELMAALLDGWALARQADPVIARSRLIFRGHLGAGHARGANAHAYTIAARAEDDVQYRGPVDKGDLAATYSGFDALVLAVIGGRYMTSGKVYEYAATGLPIVSVHEWEHDAATVLADHPLWVRCRELAAAGVRDAFVETAKVTLEATSAQRAQARSVAARYERSRLVRPAIADLAGRFGAPRAEAAR